jgi:hypothetical protein
MIRELTDGDWCSVFEKLPVLMPEMGFSRVSADRYESPFKIGGTEPQKPRKDKTKARLFSDGIEIREEGEDPKRLESVLTNSYRDSMQIIRELLGVHNFYSDTPRRSNSLPKREGFEDNSKTINAIPAGVVIGEKLSDLSYTAQKFAGEYFEKRGFYSNSSALALCSHRGGGKSRESIAVEWFSPEGISCGFGYHIDPEKVNGRFTGKAFKGWFKGESPKRNGALGGAVRLIPLYGDTLGICEGVEDALAIMWRNGATIQNGGIQFKLCAKQYSKSNQIPDELSLIPVWASLSADNLVKFIPPPSIRKIIVFGDNDTAGEKAFKALEKKLLSEGISVAKMLPPSGKDWNEYLLSFPLNIRKEKNNVR